MGARIPLVILRSNPLNEASLKLCFNFANRMFQLVHRDLECANESDIGDFRSMLDRLPLTGRASAMRRVWEPRAEGRPDRTS